MSQLHLFFCSAIMGVCVCVCVCVCVYALERYQSMGFGKRGKVNVDLS